MNLELEINTTGKWSRVTELCKSLVQDAENLQQQTKQRDALFEKFYKNGGVSLIQLKTLAHGIQIHLDNKRKKLTEGKQRLDLKQLKLENLRYKEAFLRREIRECKNLHTPETDKVES